MKKRVSSFMPAMVFVCVFSTAGFEFRFPVQDGTYKLENMEQKQSERIDGKVFFDGITAYVKFIQWYSHLPPAVFCRGHFAFPQNIPSLQNCSFS